MSLPAPAASARPPPYARRLQPGRRGLESRACRALAHRAQAGALPAARDVTATVRARPTLYKGVQMRSRLEADYAADLDRQGVHWHYEPKCFGGPDGQWLPDFMLSWPCGNPECSDPVVTYVEVKPVRQLAKVTRRYLALMPVVWLSEPEAYVRLEFWRYGGPFAAVVTGSHKGWRLHLPGLGESNALVTAADVGLMLDEYESLGGE